MSRGDQFQPENRIRPKRYIGKLEVISRDERREELQILDDIPISEGITYSEEKTAFVEDQGIKEPWYEHVIHVRFTAQFQELGGLAEVNIEAQPVLEDKPKSQSWSHLSEIQALTSPDQVVGYSIEVSWESTAGGTQNHLHSIVIVTEKQINNIRIVILNLAEALLQGGKTCEGAFTEALAPLGKKVTYRRQGVSLPKK